MHSPVQAIGWEMFARGRWHVLLAFAPLAICAGVIEQVMPGGILPGYESVAVTQAMSCLVTYVTIVWIASFTETDPRGRFGGYPAWMYTLPVRTSVLALFPMLCGTVLMATAVLLWELNICWYWKLPIEAPRLCWHVLVATSTLACIQAVIWSLYRLRWTRITALVVVIFAGLYSALFTHALPASRVPWFIGALAVMATAPVIAVISVERDRRGSWNDWSTKVIDWLLDRLPQRKGTFASAAHAQVWFEWRRRGIFLACAFGICMAFTMLVLPLPMALYLDTRELLGVFCVPFGCMLVVLGAGGGLLAKSDPWSADVSLHGVIATKPVNTSRLVFAKMKAAAGVVALGGLVWLLLGIPEAIWSGNHEWPNPQAQRYWVDFRSIFPRVWAWVSNPVVDAALFAVAWHAIVGAMAIVLTGNRRRILLQGIIGVSVWAGGISFAVWVAQRPGRLDFCLPIVGAAAIMLMLLKLAAAGRGFARARRVAQVDDLRVAMGLWIVVTLLVLAAGGLAQAQHGMDARLLWSIIALLFFPAGEIPGCIVALDRNRHR